MINVNKYGDLPIINRFGIGNYTYKFIIDNSQVLEKYEIFANTIDEVIYIIGCTFGNVLSWSYINNDVLSLSLDGYELGTYLVYI